MEAECSAQDQIRAAGRLGYACCKVYKTLSRRKCYDPTMEYLACTQR